MHTFEFIRPAEAELPDRFGAHWFHLWEFESDDWLGAWWKTLRWRLIA